MARRKVRRSTDWARGGTGTVVFAAVAGLLVTGVMSASTASNTVTSAKAGDGSATIAGYTLSNVDYILNATAPQNLDRVTFSLDSVPAAGSSIRAKLVAAGSTWYPCTSVGTSVSCTTTAPQASAVTADQLRVVIAQ